MPLVDTSTPQTLEDALTSTANDQTANIQSSYAKKRRQLLGQEAASGRLMSGVSDYDLSDLDSAEGTAESQVQSGLAGALGSVTSEDYLNQKNFSRNQQLAQLIGRLQKPSTLDEALGGVQAFAGLASTMAAFA